MAREQNNSNEYEIKAAFLYNLARMTEWPAAPAGPSFLICFIGRENFGNALNNIKNKNAHNRPLAFRMVKSTEPLEECHMLFIAASEQTRLPRILAVLKQRPILTVGDTHSYAERGCMVNLIKVDSRLQVEINLSATQRSGLKISSRLLTLAKIIDKGAAGTVNGLKSAHLFFLFHALSFSIFSASAA